jgi:hypothetical protein
MAEGKGEDAVTPPYGTRFRTPRGWFTFKPEVHLCEGCAMDWFRNMRECAELPGCEHGIWVRDGDAPKPPEPKDDDGLIYAEDIF